MRKWLSALLCGLLMVTMAATAFAAQDLDETVIESTMTDIVFEDADSDDIESFVELPQGRALVALCIGMDFTSHYGGTDKSDEIFPYSKGLVNDAVVGLSKSGNTIYVMLYVDDFMMVCNYNVPNNELEVFTIETGSEDVAVAVIDEVMEEKSSMHYTVDAESLSEVIADLQA